MITKEHARRIRKRIEQAAVSLNDEDALDAIEMYPVWKTNVSYVVNFRLRYGEKLYKVVQAHTSQIGWEPDKTPALFTEVPKPGEIPVWVQPTGAQDAYHMGDKVHYPDAEGPVYISIVDNNVWQPGVYGWEQEV